MNEEPIEIYKKFVADIWDIIGDTDNNKSGRIEYRLLRLADELGDEP